MSLTVYRASAGSGKTFKLTEMFLRLLFRNTNNYRHILAVTFTNKATEEMKRRVLEELYILARKKKSKYAACFKELTTDELAEKAQDALYKILHDYSHFHISTIDSFFQRIIRAFLKEIGLDFGFDVELDHEKVLTEVTDRLMLQTGTDATLDSWLIDFAESRMEEGKSWNIEKEIKKLGHELFRETFKMKRSVMEEGLTDKQLLIQLRTELNREIKKFESEMKQIGIQALQLLAAKGLRTDDFKNKKNSFANHFNKIIDGDYEPSKRVNTALDNVDEWYTGNTPQAAAIKEIFPQLNDLLRKSVALYKEKYKSYNSYKIILQNFSTLGIMVDLTLQLKEYKNEKSIFLLADSGDFLSHIIAGSDAPFVYEKTGTGIAHFMIDEFQDTSHIQWQNFKPLILNSLAQNNDCLLVGDVKQSIYRWRNSDWNILAKEVLGHFPGMNITEKHLEHNWRSQGNIMRYNNSVFASAAKLLEDHFNSQAENPTDIISHAYHDTIQKKESDNKLGHINVQFLKAERKEDYTEQVLQKIPALLEKFQDAGHPLSATAIIVRTGREGKNVADYLMAYQKEHPGKYRYDVISDESIYLVNSPAIQFIEGLLRHLLKTESVNIAALTILYYRYIKPQQFDNIHAGLASDEFFNNHIQQVLDSAELLKKDFSLSELTEQIIMLFHLDQLKDHLPYIQSFQDCVNDFSKRRNADLSSFLDWWDEERENFTISVCSEQNAARILTVHKSKGLEYKNVIIPFCNWELDHRTNREIVLWCPMPAQDSLLSGYTTKLQYIPLMYHPRMMESYFHTSYMTEKNQAFVDNLNLLYVAFTRACDNLVVFAPEPARDNLNNVGSLLYKVVKTKLSGHHFLDLSTFWNEEKKEFLCGNIVKAEKKEAEKIALMPLTDYPVVPIRQKLKQKYSSKEYFLSSGDIKQTPVNFGMLMHYVFSKIKDINDVDRIINEIVLQGKLTREEAANFKSELIIKFKDNIVQSWFSDQWDDVHTEADILLPKGFQYRPDRVMIKGNQAIVVDYKFGENEDVKYNSQIKKYMSLLVDMNYKPVRGYLWYYMMGKIVEVSKHEEGKTEQGRLF